MSEIILEARRTEARRAMEGEVWQKKREAEAEVLLRRREEARLAMESKERRIKRQATEAASREETVAVARRKAAEDEKRAAAQEAAQSAVEAERQRATQATAEAAANQLKAKATSQTIDRLKVTPVEMSPIRTLKTDLAQAAAAGATLTQAIIREQGQAPSFGPSANLPKSHRGWLTILALTLLLLGGTILVYIYYYWTPAAIAPPPPGTAADPDEQLFIFTDERVEIENPLKLRQALNDGTVNTGRVTRLIPTEAARPLALKPWLKQLSISLPEKLLQSLEQKFLLGRYDDIDSPTAFLMLQTKSYEASFSGLRQNEKLLIDLFYHLTGRSALSPTTTPIFTDQLRHNLETRRAKQDDKTILLYAFLDQSTIAITENENALEEILNHRRTSR